MEKPLAIRIQETENELVKIINNSGLHSYILKNILEKIFNQLNEIEINEIEEWKKEKENEKNDKKSIETSK